MEGPECGEALTLSQFQTIFRKISTEHKFGASGHMVKYIMPTIDLRTNTVFHVVFSGLFNTEGKEFDFRDNSNSMFDNINAWLNNY